ncbi:MAG: DUF6691 family protein [Thermodesulfobacteriota bacterium]|nr:DUF6691 family protein [Thermodesulfobacteriota bacterium]
MDLGLVQLVVKATVVGSNILGGLIFGLGWGLLGYCPATAVGALGEGRWDGLWGVLGMLAGAALFAEAYPVFKGTVLAWGAFDKITLPQILRVNHWVIMALFVVGGVSLFGWFEKGRL